MLIDTDIQPLRVVEFEISASGDSCLRFVCSCSDLLVLNAVLSAHKFISQVDHIDDDHGNCYDDDHYYFIF